MYDVVYHLSICLGKLFGTDGYLSLVIVEKGDTSFHSGDLFPLACESIVEVETISTNIVERKRRSIAPVLLADPASHRRLEGSRHSPGNRETCHILLQNVTSCSSISGAASSKAIPLYRNSIPNSALFQHRNSPFLAERDEEMKVRPRRFVRDPYK